MAPCTRASALEIPIPRRERRDAYEPSEAREECSKIDEAGHLNRKHQYLQEKGLVPSAEAFIQRRHPKQYEWASLSGQVRFEASRKPAPIGSARSWKDTVNGDIEACFGDMIRRVCGHAGRRSKLKLT